MKAIRLLSLFVCLAAASQASVVTKIYSGYTTSGGGTPYTDYVGSIDTPGITFATDTGYNWHPFGLNGFGADVLASLLVPTTGDYTFHLSSDDGSLVFIDDVLLIDRGRSPWTQHNGRHREPHCRGTHCSHRILRMLRRSLRPRFRHSHRHRSHVNAGARFRRSAHFRHRRTGSHPASKSIPLVPISTRKKGVSPQDAPFSYLPRYCLHQKRPAE